MLNQPIKLTRSKYTYTKDGRTITSLYNYVVAKHVLEANKGYELVTEDATLLAWSTEAEDGRQSVVGIVKLMNGSIVVVSTDSIIFRTRMM